MNIIKKQKVERNEWLVKAPQELKRKLDEARVERIKNGLDNKLKSYTELLDASTRFAPLWDILKRAEIKKPQDKK
jgi:hypothetical protein